MKDTLIGLAQSEGGKRFLINLLESLHLGHVTREHVLEVVTALRSPASPDSWDEHRLQIARVIFTRPDNFQFYGPPAVYSPAEWMTIKSMADLLFFLRRDDGSIDPTICARLGLTDPTGAHHGFRDEHYRRFADALSDGDDAVRFLLAHAFPSPANPAVRRPAPGWFSRWCGCGFRHSLTYPSADASGRLRDWLGLTYGMDEPLFVIRAREPRDVLSLRAHRPTPWEGFDNPLYKHRTTNVLDAEGCGSTTDLVKVRAGNGIDADVEGGPEVVSRGVVYDSTQYVCEYLGKAPQLGYDLFGGTFHQVLLRTGQTLDWVINQLTELLWPDGVFGATR